MNLLKTVLTLLLLSMSSSLMAQSFIGVFGGLASGSLSGDAPDRFIYTSSVSGKFGLALDLRLKEDVFLVFQPGFFNSSPKLQYPVEVEEDEFVLKDSILFDISLITLPIVLKLISDNKRFEFTGGFEWLLPLKFTADNTAEETDLMDKLNMLNISMQFGIGYRIPIKKSLMVVGITYSQGLTNLANNLDDPDSILPRVRVNTFNFNASWYLPVGSVRKEP